MAHILINGKSYAPDDTVPWDDAVAQGGFYFDRAAYLGLPEPTAILFSPSRHGYLDAIAAYHSRFKSAEADAVTDMMPWD
jgi:hypothetical protein